MLGLTGAQGGGRDLDLAGGLVGLEGRGPASSAEVCSEQVRALGPCGAGAGTIASMVGLLFVIHCYQLEEGGRTEERSEDVGFEKHGETAVRLKKTMERRTKKYIKVNSFYLT